MATTDANSSANGVKGLIKYGWGGLCLCSLAVYSLEFAKDQTGHIKPDEHEWHHAEGGFISLFTFIILISIVGLVGACVGSEIVALVYTILFTALVIVDRHFVGAIYAYVIGQLACGFGLAYAFSGGMCSCCGGGGGGGGGDGKK